MQPTQDTFGGICFRWHPNIQFNWYLIGRKHGWVDVSYLHGNLLLPRKWLRCFSTGRPPRFESGTSWTQVRNGETHPRILSRRAWTLSRKTKTKKKTYPVKRPRGWLGWAMEIQWIFERFTLGSWNGGRTKSSWSTMSCYLRRWLGRCIVFLFFFGWSLDDISRTNTNNTLDHLARRQIINTLPTKPPPKYCLRQIFSSSRLTRVTALALGM